MTVLARELCLEDLDAVRTLRAKHGLSLPTESQWRNLHVANPARAEMPGAPLGWVLDDEGIVGCFLNVPLRWAFRGKPVRVAATSGWIVADTHRHSSFLLMTRYFSQRGVDLWLNTTANLLSSKAFEAFKGDAVPSVGTTSVFTWIVRPSAVGAYLETLVPRPVKSLVVNVARAAEQSFRLILSRRPGITVLDTPDDRFDALWERLRTTSGRCMQTRDAVTLRWLFRGFQSGSRFIVLDRAGGLAGYAALARRDHPATGLSRYRLVDLQAIDDDPVVLRELMRAALRLAFDEGIVAVEAIGFHVRKREALAGLFPFRRRLPHWHFYFRARAELALDLASSEFWDPCEIEGDGVVGVFDDPVTTLGHVTAKSPG